MGYSNCFRTGFLCQLEFVICFRADCCHRYQLYCRTCYRERERERDGGRRAQTILTVSIILCLSPLVFFKYLNFFIQTGADIFSFFGANKNPRLLKLVLPVGISFFSFQAISYIVDIYRGKIAAEKHLGIYSAFMMFFPQLLSGPISRAGFLLPQIKEKRDFSDRQATDGLRIILWGFFEKFVIADNLAVFVNKVYGDLHSYSGFALVLVAVLYSIQIYCDFSGYTDIASGAAKLLGIDLPDNFRSPYLSTTVKEFWSRWHISLSTWFRDYVYIPLGGNRCSKERHRFNLLITFLVSGLWHGADWSFVLWGGIHGVAQDQRKIWQRKTTPSEAEADAKSAYDRHFVTNKLNGDGELIINEDNINALYSMIEICRDKNIAPIMVTVPCLSEYTNEIINNRPEIIDVCHDIIQQVINDTNASYFDYCMDERFASRYDLFTNSDHLNKEGAKLFTGYLLCDIGLMK